MQLEQVLFYIGFDQVIKEIWPNKRLHHKSFLFYQGWLLCKQAEVPREVEIIKCTRENIIKLFSSSKLCRVSLNIIFQKVIGRKSRMKYFWEKSDKMGTTIFGIYLTNLIGFGQKGVFLFSGGNLIKYRRGGKSPRAGLSPNNFSGLLHNLLKIVMTIYFSC